MNKIFVVWSYPLRPQNLNFNVCLLSETWEPVKCSTCTSPNTVYVEIEESFFHHPECLKVTAVLFIFTSHWLICNFALSYFCWCALDKSSGTQVYCCVISRPLIQNFNWRDFISKEIEFINLLRASPGCVFTPYINTAFPVIYISNTLLLLSA